MKTQYLVCCSLLLLLSSLLVVEAFQISCGKNASRNTKCRKVEKFREDTKFITAMQEKRLAQRRREICLTARELNCDKELESKSSRVEAERSVHDQEA